MRFDRRDLRSMPEEVREELDQRDGCWQELSEEDRGKILSGDYGSVTEVANRLGLRRRRLQMIRAWVQERWEAVEEART